MVQVLKRDEVLECNRKSSLQEVLFQTSMITNKVNDDKCGGKGREDFLQDSRCREVAEFRRNGPIQGIIGKESVLRDGGLAKERAKKVVVAVGWVNLQFNDGDHVAQLSRNGSRQLVGINRPSFLEA